MNAETRQDIDNFKADTSEGCTVEEQFEAFLKFLQSAGKISKEERWAEYNKLFPQ